jgi:biotin synthase-related radical SAM superfamily protein
VKLAITRGEDRFTLEERAEGGYRIMEGDEVFSDDVRIIHTLLHAPEQAFVNIDTECIFRCVFCNTWKLDPAKWTKRYTLEKWADLIAASSERPGFHSVAITTSVPHSVKESNERIFRLLELLEGRLPGGTEIGVEPCMDDPADVMEFKKRGVTELKLNVQAATEDIFRKICPGMDQMRILAVIEEAGKHMKVCSNIIVGLGETDAEVEAMVERLGGMNCAANIRGIRVNDGNRDGLSRVLGFEARTVEPARLVGLARAQKDILKKFNIDTRVFHTMCHRCTCCDIEPFIDV